MDDRSELSKRVGYLNYKLIRFFWDDFCDLNLDYDGKVYRKVSAREAFPLDAPRRYISLTDAQNQEIGIINNPMDLDKSSRDILESVLELTYYMPRITRINDVKFRSKVPCIDVDTDRGNSVFEFISLQDPKDARPRTANNSVHRRQSIRDSEL